VRSSKWRSAAVLALAMAMLAPMFAWRPSMAQSAPLSREVLALIDSSEVKPGSEFLPTRTTLIHALAEMPLNFLGLRLHYLDVEKERLPSDDEMRRYIGVITWFQDEKIRDPLGYLAFLRRQIQAGRRVVVIGGLGASTDIVTGADVPFEEIEATFAAMGITHTGLASDNPLLLSVRNKVSSMVEFERTLDNELLAYEQFRSIAPTNRVYLTLNRSDLVDGDSDLVVTGTWGGFVFSGYDYYEQARTFHHRWRLNPFAFFEEAFGIKGYPRPDVSTLNGSRVFYTHVDGDGFNNVTEIDYTSLSSEVLLQRFIRKYDLPFTMSIVVSDIDPAVSGGDRQIRVAREIFAQPNVEGASHTYTHPFDWSKPVDLQRELNGAVEFLNERIAAPGRPVPIVLWSGATNPGPEAVARSYELGILNINGGDGRFDAARNSYTALAPLTTQVGNFVQFYTSNANDNIYGNDWTGPYYGLRDVIETFEKTESPRRIGALNVYYHIFTAEKHAAVRALEEVYDWCVAHDIAPMFTSDYVRTVQGFMSTQIAREGDNGWRIRDYGILRTMRFDDETRVPDLRASQNVIGYQQYQGSLYVFLGEAPESLIMLTTTAPTQPYVAQASHRVLDWRQDGNALSLRMEGIGRKKLVIGNLRPNADFELIEQAGGERRLQLRTDGQGMLTWASDAKGPIRVSVPNAVGR
jgi:hypothetical protein